MQVLWIHALLCGSFGISMLEQNIHLSVFDPTFMQFQTIQT